MRNIILKSSLFLSLFAFAACGKDEEQITTDNTYAQGVFVTCEGVWGVSSGVVTMYNPNAKTVVSEDLFQYVNNRQLGNIVYSVAFDNDYAYIVVNAANKVEIVNKNTWVESAQITDVENPRFVEIIGDYIYISQWGSDGMTGAVKVYNRNDFSLKTTINTYAGAERLMLVDGKLWVTHTGGYGIDNRIAIIDLSTHTIDNTISLNYENIISIAKANDGTLWLACAGNSIYTNYPEIDSSASTPSALVQLSSNGTILKEVALEVGGYANNMVLNNNDNILYYIYKDGVYQYNISSENNALYQAGSFYGLGFDNAKNELYMGRNNTMNPAKVIRMNSNGIAIDSFTTGAAYPNGIIIKN